MESRQLNDPQSPAFVRLPDAVTKFCEHVGCPKPVALNHRGRPAKFCSPTHKVAAFRAKHRSADVGREVSQRKLVKDHPAFQIVNTPIQESVLIPVNWHGAGDNKLLGTRGVKPRKTIPNVIHRIPKYGQGMANNSTGAQPVSIPHKVTHQVDVNDREGVSGEGRYTSPSNSYPAEEKLTRVIFGRKRA